MHTIISKSETIATFLEKGAELISLKNALGKEFIWEGNPDFWGKHSPILFPIVGTLKNNSYEYQGTQYSLSRHGFARDHVFSVRSKTANSITFSLSDSETTLKVFPFRFELQITYTLDHDTLQVAFHVINKDQGELPFSIGAHPAFGLSENFEDYSLLFENTDKLQYNLLDNDLISSETKTLLLFSLISVFS